MTSIHSSRSTFPNDPGAHLAALADCVDAAAARITAATIQVVSLRSQSSVAPDGGVHQLLAADQVVRGAIGAAIAGEAAAVELNMTLSGHTGGLRSHLVAAFAKGDVSAAGELAALAEGDMVLPCLDELVDGVFSELRALAGETAKRVPSLSFHLDIATWTVAMSSSAPPEADHVVAVDLDRCGTAELMLLVTDWGNVEVDWTHRLAVVIVPAILAAHLGAHRAATDLGPSAVVAFDPIPFSPRVCDQLSRGTAVADVYDDAVASGRKCAARHRPSDVRPAT